MSIDPSNFNKTNVIDTCAIWNLLASPKFRLAARVFGLSLCCTRFVVYECLYKARTKVLPTDVELMNRFREQEASEEIVSVDLSISDLQSVELLENRKRLSKGELSSIAFAKKTGQAFLTDDQKARKLATQVLDTNSVQTTPHLFAALFFNNYLSDTDKQEIIEEHVNMDRPLAQFLEEAYLEALRCRLMHSQTS
ncbi:MAG: hypothetical protein ACE361_12110 [Aureliella sp.]